MTRPRILLTNDDGIEAPGLAALAGAMQSLGETIVIAPPREASAVGHAVSVNKDHVLRPFYREGRLFGHSFDGWPADCVKFAVTRWLSTAPDLVVSGINPSPNVGTNVPYSGTVAAAVEAAMLGVPGMAVSTAWPRGPDPPDFGVAARIAVDLARDILEGGLAPHVALNVNVPLIAEKDIRGYKVAPQGFYCIRDRFEPLEPAPDGAARWTNTGVEPVASPAGEETDDRALAEGYVAITPLGFDMTAYGQLEEWRRRLDGARQ